MAKAEYMEPSIEEVERMVKCDRTAEFILWDTDGPRTGSENRQRRARRH